jgi:transcriptional regulator with XRE-family HTH domain
MPSPGELLREARKRHGVTQAQLAARARTSQAAISRIERGLVSPSIASLAHLLEMLNEELQLSSRPVPYHGNRDVLRDNLRLTAEERIDQGAAIGAYLQGKTPPRPAHAAWTLHAELARLLCESGDRWLTTVELAKLVNDAGRFRKRDGTPVTDFQVHGRTKNYPHVFERSGTRVRLARAGP